MSTLTLTDDPGPRPSGIGPALVVALCLHAAALTGLALYTPSQPAPPGENTISIDLAPQMTEADTQAPAQQAQSDFAPPVANPVDTPETVSALTPHETVAVPPPDTAEVRPEEATTAKPLEAQATPPTEALATPVTEAQVEPPPDTLAEAQPEDQVVTSTAEQAEPMAPPPPVVAKPPEPPKPVEVARPKPPDPAKLEAQREARREAKRIAEREARLEAEVEAKRQAVREAKIKAAREAARRASEAAAGNARQSSAATSRQSSAGVAAAGNDPSALRAWQGALSSAIHGRMNRNAAAGTAGGVAVVRFTVSRSGQVLSAGLASGSGIGAIDSAALATVRGSLPAAPAGVSVSSLAVTVPLRFSPGR